MLIDAHTHLFCEKIHQNRENYFDDPNFELLYNHAKARLSTPATIFSYQEENQIDLCLTYGFCWQNLNRCLQQNDFLKETEIKNSQKIIPFAAITPAQEMSLSEQMHRIKKAGFVGIGELAFYTQGFGQAEEQFLAEIFQLAVELDLFVSLHVAEPLGHDYPGKYNSRLQKLSTLIANNPQTKIILAHWGGGLFFYELMPEIRKNFANVYYDTAASPYLYDPKIFEVASILENKEKILLGTDYPLLKMPRYLKQLQNLDQNFIEQISYKNACNLFKLKK